MGQTIVENVIEYLQAAQIRADEAYPGGRIPALTGPVAAVRLGRIDRAVRSTAVLVTIMSPADQGGSACETIALRATQALEDQGAVCQKEVCKFDDMADLFYIEITAAFFGVATEDYWEAGPGFSIKIGLQPLPCAVGFSIDLEKEKDASSISTAKWSFTLEELLGVYDVDPPLQAEPFTLSVKRPLTDEEFTDCTWTSVRREETIRGIRQIRTGTAGKRKVSGII